MKRKRLDRDKWTSIKSKKYIQKNIRSEDFTGIVSLLYIYEVSPPSVWNTHCGDITICGSNMKWLQLLPENGQYLLTAMINDKNNINIYYVDIIESSGLEQDGVAYFNDLYLDIIILPDGSMKIDDEDELKDALLTKDITEAQYLLALETKNSLINGILKNVNELNNFCMQILKEIDNKQ